MSTVISFYPETCMNLSTIYCLCGGDSEVGEESAHPDAEGVVVAVDSGSGFRWPAWRWAAEAGEDRRDDLVAEGGDARNDAGRFRADAVTAGASGLLDEIFAAEFPQIVGGLPDGVVVLGLPGEIAGFLGEVARG